MFSWHFHVYNTGTYILKVSMYFTGWGKLELENLPEP